MRKNCVNAQKCNYGKIVPQKSPSLKVPGGLKNIVANTTAWPFSLLLSVYWEVSLALWTSKMGVRSAYRGGKKCRVSIEKLPGPSAV